MKKSPENLIKILKEKISSSKFSLKDIFGTFD